jgi:hypothetical protein
MHIQKIERTCENKDCGKITIKGFWVYKETDSEYRKRKWCCIDCIYEEWKTGNHFGKFKDIKKDETSKKELFTYTSLTAHGTNCMNMS